MKFKIMLLGMFLLLGLMTLPSVFALVGDNVTVSVQISAVSAIELNETTIDFGAVAPGANSSVKDMVITNIGSNSVTDLYADVNTLNKNATNPRGGDDATGYMASQWLGLKNGSAGSTPTVNAYFQTGAILWNYSVSESVDGWTFITGYNGARDKRMFGELWLDGTGTADLWYWEVLNGTGGGGTVALCNESTTNVNVAQSENDKDVSDGGTISTATAGAQNTAWATWTFSDGPLTNYCLATYHDCTKAYLYRWSFNSTFGACTSKQYITRGTVSPSDTVTVSMKMVVPVKIPDGTGGSAPTDSTLTIWAT